MCGIIGIIGKQPVAQDILDGLRRLEYRGYDSAGIATVDDGSIHRRRAPGKIRNLSEKMGQSPLSGMVGIGHTRWATHGEPNEANAHPHMTERVALVHNGIIENYDKIKASLDAQGVVFETETDTEVIVHLLDRRLQEGLSPQEAIKAVMKELEGAFALGVIFKDYPDILIGARRGAPLAVGYGDGEMFLASDAQALAPLTNKLSYLKDDDCAIITRDGADIYDKEGNSANREIITSSLTGVLTGKGSYRHFMHKEIYEQPQVLGQTISAFTHTGLGEVNLPDMPFDLADIDCITLSACGTAYYASMVGRYWFEEFARLPVEIDIASEFRYREPPLKKGGLAIFLTQSGETMDTLEALRYAKSCGQHIMSIVNVKESTIARESDVVLHTLAGPEIGVASTKAFTTQLAVLFALAVKLGLARGTLDAARAKHLLAAFREVPSRFAEAMNTEKHIFGIAHDFVDCADMVYLGRGTSCPIAMEGALKLKEVSYIHAEGYASGELKHGPIALVDEALPIVVIAPRDRWFEKTLSNMKEVHARGGPVLFISDKKGIEEAGEAARWTITMPEIDPALTPILYALPVQLIAYHTAVLKGTDVDQPRNLAKSVTVE